MSTTPRSKQNGPSPTLHREKPPLLLTKHKELLLPPKKLSVLQHLHSISSITPSPSAMAQPSRVMLAILPHSLKEQVSQKQQPATLHRKQSPKSTSMLTFALRSLHFSKPPLPSFSPKHNSCKTIQPAPISLSSSVATKKLAE